MRRAIGFVALSIFCSTVNAKTLPDEINYPPYHDIYTDLDNQKDDIKDQLDGSKESLTEILKSIADSKQAISDMEAQIEEYLKQVGQLEYEIPRTKQELAESQRDLRASQATISQLEGRLNNQENNLRRSRNELAPLKDRIQNLESQISRKNQQLSNLDQREKAKKREVQKGKSDIQALTAKIQSLNSKLAELKGKESTLKGELTKLRGQLNTSNSTLSGVESDYKKAKSKVGSLQDRFKAEKNTLNNLKRSGAEPEKIAEQERKVKAVKATLDAAKLELAPIEDKRNKLVAKVDKLKKDISSKESEIASLPRDIQNTTNQIQNSKNEKNSIKAAVASAESVLITLRRDIVALEGELNSLDRRLAAIQRDAQQIRSRIKDIKDRIALLDNDLRAQRQFASQMSSHIESLSASLASMEAELPELNRAISANKDEINRTRHTISRLENEELLTRNEIARLESEYSDISQRTSNAYNEYIARLGLYEEYEDEAREIGTSQTGRAVDLGKSKGAALAKSISSDLAKSFGTEEGSTQAKLIGFVRGEISGYEAGYTSGVNSSDSIQAGTSKGEEKGKEGAYAYVETNVKPGYFENYIQQMLRNGYSIVEKGISQIFRSKSSTVELKRLEAMSFKGIPDLETNELNTSRGYKTSMDDRIEVLVSESYDLGARFEQFKDPEVAYERPDTVPYTKVNCRGVYKGVSDFVKACESSFRKSFSYYYYKNSLESFSEDYPDLFISKYNSYEESTRSAQYNANFQLAKKAGLAQGELDGKQDAYDQAYEVAYEEAYSANLGPAKELANEAAKRESNEWVAANPIVTSTSSKILESNLRGGSTGHLVIDLKNISPVDSNATGILRIKTSQSISFQSQSFKLPSVGARDSQQMTVPFTVNSNADSRDIIKIEATLELPGDKYQSVRKENIKLMHTLMVNPKHSRYLNYDKTPKVRGLFRYKTHELFVTLRPVVEDLNDKYTVKVSVVDEVQKDLIKFNGNTLDSKILKRGEEEKLTFSYTFSKKAKKKKLKLKVETFFKGISLGDEVITLAPR